MKIRALTLQTTQLETQKAFYTSLLHLPLLAETQESFTVKAGETRITFEVTEQRGYVYHFAFKLPLNQFAEGKAWLQQRVPLLQEDGQDEFAATNWVGRSCYFYDAAGNILEFLVRADLPEERPEDTFSSDMILRVGEIGLAVEDPFITSAYLQEQFNYVSIKKEPGPTFNPIGDRYGSLIVVKLGRSWFPTTKAAVSAPIRVEIEGDQPQQALIPGTPYELRIVPGEPA
uniref:VOC domain-containing protein n=1 Tax=Thermosporothrix sp. COM3 TaxID=2490863 RepID=A0A455SQT7_9CHLR|nr:hypothetical protein KTC_22550 [Thermosporothrix sp. COM3]